MNRPTPVFRWSFQTKVLVPVLTFLVALPMVTLWVVNRHIDEQVRNEARQSLATADAVFRNSLEIRARNLVSRFRNSVNEPRFRAVAQLGDAGTMSDFLHSALDEFGEETEIAIYSTTPDQILASAHRDATLAPDLFARAASGIIEPAFAGGANAGVIHLGRRVLNVVSVPVTGTDRAALIGTLTLGIRLGLNAAHELQSLTRTEVVLLADDQVATSTLRHPDLTLPAMLPGAVQSVVIDDEHFLALANSHAGGDPSQGFSYVLLSSYEARLLALRRTQTTLITFSLAGIMLSAVVVWFLIRRITQPLRVLRSGAEAVGRGDFSHRVPHMANDETGELADAFNQMTASVENSHDTLAHTVTTLRETQGRLLERELRLRASEEELRLIIASARDHAIFTLNEAGRVVRWNPGAERLFAYAADQVQGIAYSNFFAPEDAHAGLPERTLAEATSNGQHAFEGWRVRRDGSRFWADVTLSRLPDPSGRGTAGFVEIARDITVRKEAEEALRRARDAAEATSRAKSEFLANMSHEIRTPMNAVLGFTSLLIEQQLAPAQLELATTIRTGAESLLAVIDDLLDLTKLEAGNLEIRPQDGDLRSSVEKVAADHMEICAQKQLSLSVRCAAAVPPIVTVDSMRVRQILKCLVGNAVKFTERGRIEITLARAPDAGTHMVRFIVSDTGIGIPHEQQGNLFRPFFQVDSSAARRFGGTGLGLALAKRLIELLGGMITCESAPDQGSRFTFTLPAPVPLHDSTPPPRLSTNPMPAADVAPAPPTGNDRTEFARRHPMRVLVVEDNLINTKVLTLILGKLGYKADTAANGLEALQRLEERRYDVVFMDLQMPELDGIEATKRLRERIPVTSPPYVLAFTANASQEDRGACVAAGMHDFEAKPANIEKITRALERAYAWITAHGTPTSGN